MKVPSDAVERVESEFAGAQLGDPRRTRRVQNVVAKLMHAPSVPLPNAMGTSAELEGCYRIVNNGRVTFEALLGAHADKTRERAEAAQKVLVIHDTTPCSFPHGDGEEIGYLTTGKPGFPLHLALVLDAAGWRRPLGVVHGEALFRPTPSKGKSKGKRKRRAKQDSEFERWWRGIQASSEALSSCDEVVHVADCEGDSYELLAKLADAGERFVIRVRVSDRRGRDSSAEEDSWSTVREVARKCEGVLERDVALTRRKPHKLANQKKAHPPRKSRLAHLQFAATKVVIPRPHRVETRFPKTLELNLVHVRETKPEPAQPEVEWLLYTSEPIDTPEEVAEVVDMYRARWTIEEFNAALKTGCAYESRQFESRHALLNMLALSLPVACELLWLRSRARSAPQAPASDVLTEIQMEVLRALGHYKLPANPTTRDALLAVAALGGHVKANGDPGWKVLYRGMTKLLDYQRGWVAAKEARGADL